MSKNLPSVNELLAHLVAKQLTKSHGRLAVLDWIRTELANRRRELRKESDPATPELVVERETLREEIAAAVMQRSQRVERSLLQKVVNATGVVLHPSFGRAPLSLAARQALVEVATGCNLEVDLVSGEPRQRGYQLDSLWQLLTGCESSLVVNNNAAATLLTLQALCSSREVIVSRGELIEIGNSYRLPEIIALSGAVLREVGTTNGTRLSDYAKAIGPQTAAILRVHPSNYKIIGNRERPPAQELAALAHERGVIAIDDIGGGAMFDTERFGFGDEPTIPQSLKSGADIVLASGDKLLGGPQCGIILGKKSYLDAIQQHPLARVVRVDKLTLGALSATLDAYLREEALAEIPTLVMLSLRTEELQQRSEKLVAAIGTVAGLDVSVRPDVSAVGGDVLPGVELPGPVVSIWHREISADILARRLRVGTPRIFARVHPNQVILDLRSVLPEDDLQLAPAVRLACEAE